MKRMFSALIAFAPIAARAEVLDKQPSVAFLLAATASASFITFNAARRTIGKLALLGFLPIIVFVPAIAEQLDPIMNAAIYAEGGVWYVFCVWVGPVSVPLAFAIGRYLRAKPLTNPLPPVVFFLAVSVLGALALSSLSGMSAIWSCLIVGCALLVNGLVATVEDRNA